MKIQGVSFVHASQAMSGPHRANGSSAVGGTSTLAELDQLDISPSADMASRALENASAGIRADRVAQIRSAIEAGNYDTDEKLSMALDRLLDEIG